VDEKEVRLMLGKHLSSADLERAIGLVKALNARGTPAKIVDFAPTDANESVLFMGVERTPASIMGSLDRMIESMPVPMKLEEPIDDTKYRQRSRTMRDTSKRRDTEKARRKARAAQRRRDR
jgi:hypothetical protein